MRRSVLFVLSLGVAGVTASCNTPAQGGASDSAQNEASADSVKNELLALEQGALDRWIRVDPDGYLSLYAPEVTYFDPMRDKRIDGLPAMQALVAPLRGIKMPFTDVRYELIDPKVQRHGDVAILTFNVVNYGTLPNQPEKVLNRWNSTEVYNRVDGKWKIIHSHWSYVKPDVKQPAL
ncbi:MAG TPA: DUF4440 domain-containing protein [Gemmatimonadaceae bacterium]|nr:DUF4440 domain-containing protein [Gemmatimonadaceae bacterium]